MLPSRCSPVVHVPVDVSSLEPAPNFFSQSHAGLRTWDCTLGLLYWSSLSYREEKNFLPIHQMISSDIFEIRKMLSKRTFIFKLYSPKCVYEIIFLRSYSVLCRITFCSVIYSVPPGTQWHVFSSSNWIFLVIVLYVCSKYILSTDLRAPSHHLLMIFQRKLAWLCCE